MTDFQVSGFSSFLAQAGMCTGNKSIPRRNRSKLNLGTLSNTPPPNIKLQHPSNIKYIHYTIYYILPNDGIFLITGGG